LKTFMETEIPAPEADAAAAGAPAKTDAKEKQLIIAITTDRGLCGGVNSAVGRQVKTLARKLIAQNKEVEIMVVGDKGMASLRRDMGAYISAGFLELSKAPLTFAATSIIADRAVASKFDQATIVYNYFKTKLAYEPTQLVIRGIKSLQDSKVESSTYEFDTSCLPDLFEFNLANTLYYCIVENSTVELSSRTMAMDNATRNAGDMISRLTLFYNRSRQAVITKELIEIISGAAAV